MIAINIVGIIHTTEAMESPMSTYSIEVLGATFKEAVKDASIVEINLIRPPREVVEVGTETKPSMTITNTYNNPIYIRATYKVDIENENGKLVKDMNSAVQVTMNSNWTYCNGYWYYKDAVEANEKIECPVSSIYYGEEFAEHIEYKVYIPLLIESVEVNGVSALEAIGWDNIDINKIDAHEHLPKDVSWTQKVTFIN